MYSCVTRACISGPRCILNCFLLKSMSLVISTRALENPSAIWFVRAEAYQWEIIRYLLYWTAGRLSLNAAVVDDILTFTTVEMTPVKSDIYLSP